MKKIIIFGLAMSILVGCVSVDKNNKPVFDNKNPEKLCNYILYALHNCDIDGLSKTFNETNKQKFLPLNSKNKKRIRSICAEESRVIKGISKVSELRKGPSFMGAGSIIGKIQTIGNEVFVIVLTREGNTYAFEDINSPSVRMYSRLQLIK